MIAHSVLRTLDCFRNVDGYSLSWDGSAGSGENRPSPRVAKDCKVIRAVDSNAARSCAMLHAARPHPAGTCFSRRAPPGELQGGQDMHPRWRWILHGVAIVCAVLPQVALS